MTIQIYLNMTRILVCVGVLKRFTVTWSQTIITNFGMRKYIMNKETLTITKSIIYLSHINNDFTLHLVPKLV